MSQVATAEATRLAVNLELLRLNTPQGFGALETDLLSF